MIPTISRGSNFESIEVLNYLVEIQIVRQDLKFMLISVFDLDTHLSIQPKLLAVWLRARYKLKFSFIILRQIKRVR